MKNGYFRLLKLSSHPAFSMTFGCLVCPYCGDHFGSSGVYDKHFLRHKPDINSAERWLSGKSFDRYFRHYQKEGS